MLRKKKVPIPAEIAVEDMAVKGMDPDRHTSERGGEPAQSPGLGQMGRNDRRALAAEISIEPHPRLHVGKR